MTDWDHLPDKLLIAIFSKLKDMDLVRASCTCKNWRRVYHDPSVWRVKTFDLFHIVCYREQALKAFVTKFGPNFQHLTIMFSPREPFDLPSKTSLTFINSLLNNLSRLEGETAGLKTFELSCLDFHRLMYDRPEVMCPLTKTLLRFLSSQTTLRALNLPWAGIDRPVDLMLLQAITRSGSIETLKVLNVAEYSCFACGTKKIHNHVAYLISMCPNLREIGLNYTDLRARQIMSIWNTLKISLRKLEIVVGDYVRDTDVLSSNWWRETCFKIPELKVHLFAIETDDYILKIVVPCMPIIQVSLQGDFSLLLERYEETGSCQLLDHLIKCCPQTLESFILKANFMDQPPVEHDKELLGSDFSFKKCMLKEILMSKEII